METIENNFKQLQEAIAEENYELAAKLRDASQRLNVNDFIETPAVNKLIENAMKKAYGEKYGKNYETMIRRLQAEAIKEAKKITRPKLRQLEKHIGEYIYIQRNWEKSGGYWQKLMDNVMFSNILTQHQYCKEITKETISQIAKYLYENKDEILFF